MQHQDETGIYGDESDSIGSDDYSFKTDVGYLEVDSDDWKDNEALLIRFTDANLAKEFPDDYYGHTAWISHENLPKFIEYLETISDTLTDDSENGTIKTFTQTPSDEWMSFGPDIQKNKTAVMLYDPNVDLLDPEMDFTVIGSIDNKTLGKVIPKIIATLRKLPKL